MERVEGVEEFLLGLLLALEELDVVDQEHVDVSVFVAELNGLIVLDRHDELVGELLARDVDDVGVRILAEHAMADSMHQVGFPQANPAV